MIESINNFFVAVNGYLWGVPMIVLLLGTHIFLTIRLKVPQRKLLLGIKLSFSKDKNAQGDISPLSALFSSLAATVGTGNIIGVAAAISLGGPGAVFWCWLTGVFGMASKYGEGVLAIKYRHRGVDGEMVGGPMCAIERGLGMKWLAVLFALFTVLATFGIGNTVQSNTISTILYESLGVSPYISGAIVAILMGAVILYGVKGIARASMLIFPIMAGLYVGGCLLILFINREFVGDALLLIVSSAFDVEAVGGGIVGGGILMAARYGIARGIFSNEAGMGSAPILAASARTANPVRQALISSTGTFWDTVVICALTGVVVVSSLLANPNIDTTQGALLTEQAFAQIPYFGRPILTIGIINFCFSTLIAWYIYGEKAIAYLSGSRHWVIGFRWVNIVICYIGSISQLSLVWNFADTMNAMMAIPNLIALICLHKVIVKETNKYLWSGNIARQSDDIE